MTSNADPMRAAQVGLRSHDRLAVGSDALLIDISTLVIFAVALVMLWRFKVFEPLLVGASAIAGPGLFSLR